MIIVSLTSETLGLVFPIQIIESSLYDINMIFFCSRILKILQGLPVVQRVKFKFHVSMTYNICMFLAASPNISLLYILYVLVNPTLSIT